MKRASRRMASAVFLLASTPVLATDYSWVGPGKGLDGLWSDSANWTPTTGAPPSGDDNTATIDHPGHGIDYTVTLTSDVVVGGFTQDSARSIFSADGRTLMMGSTGGKNVYLLNGELAGETGPRFIVTKAILTLGGDHTGNAIFEFRGEGSVLNGSRLLAGRQMLLTPSGTQTQVHLEADFTNFGHIELMSASTTSLFGQGTLNNRGTIIARSTNGPNVLNFGLQNHFGGVGAPSGTVHVQTDTQLGLDGLANVNQSIITVDAGATLNVNQGTMFDQQSGVFTVNGAVTTNKNFTHSGGAWAFGPGASFSGGGFMTLDLAGGTITGNPDFNLGGVTLKLDPANTGDARFLFQGDSSVNSIVGTTLAAGREVHLVTGPTQIGVTLPAAFENQGRFEISTTSNGYLVSTGALTNTGVIVGGAGQNNLLQLTLDNQGSVTLNSNTSIGVNGSTSVNTGVITLAGGKTLALAEFDQQGGTLSVGAGGLINTGRNFTQSGGTLEFGAGAAFTGTFTTVNLAAGTITGNPDFNLNAVTLKLGASNTGDARFLFTSDASTNIVEGTTLAAGREIHVRPGPTQSGITLPAGFVNQGHIEVATDNFGHLGSTGTLVNEGTLVAGSGTQNFVSVALDNRGTFLVNTSTSVGIGGFGNSNSGSIEIAGTQLQFGGASFANSGLITGSGTLHVSSLPGGGYSDTGTVDPGVVVAEGRGGSPGLLTVRGNMDLGAAATVHIDIPGAGVAGVAYDRLAVTGNLNISDGAILEIALGNGFVPNVGDTFDIVGYGSRSGDFDLVLPTLPDGRAMEFTFGAGGASAAVVPPVEIAFASASAGPTADWFVPATWVGGNVPTTSSNVTVANQTAGPQQVSLTAGNVTIRGLNIDGTATAPMTVNADGGAFVAVSNDLSIGAHGKLVVSGAQTHAHLSGNMMLEGQMELLAGGKTDYIISGGGGGNIFMPKPALGEIVPSLRVDGSGSQLTLTAELTQPTTVATFGGLVEISDGGRSDFIIGSSGGGNILIPKPEPGGATPIFRVTGAGSQANFENAPITLRGRMDVLAGAQIKAIVNDDGIPGMLEGLLMPAPAAGEVVPTLLIDGSGSQFNLTASGVPQGTTVATLGGLVEVANGGALNFGVDPDDVDLVDVDIPGTLRVSGAGSNVNFENYRATLRGRMEVLAGGQVNSFVPGKADGLIMPAPVAGEIAPVLHIDGAGSAFNFNVASLTQAATVADIGGLVDISGGGALVFDNASGQQATMLVQDPGTLRIRGNGSQATFTNANLDVQGALEIQPGAVFDQTGGTLHVADPATLNGAMTLRDVGSASFAGGVTVNGRLTVTAVTDMAAASYAQTGAGVLVAQLDAATGGFNSINVTGAASLDGVLRIDPNGAPLTQGANFTLLTSANLGGTFDVITVPQMIPLAVQPTYAGGMVQIAFVDPNPVMLVGGGNLSQVGVTTIDDLTVTPGPLDGGGGGGATLNVDGDFTVYGLTVLGDGSQTMTVAIQDGRALSATGGVTLGTGGVLTSQSAVGGTVHTPMLAVNAGGKLSGNLSVAGSVASSGGIVSPGTAAGAISITGDYAQDATAKIEIELGGRAPGTEHDQLSVAGQATLGGATLEVRLIDGFVALPGDTFTVLTFGSRSGDVTLDDQTGFAGLVLDKMYGTTSLTIAADALLDGDANLDARVNLGDFNILANNFGLSGRNWLTADFTGDGLVNLVDFNILAGSFGLSASGSEVTPDDWAALASAVPEPAGTLALTGVVAPAATLRRRRAVR